MQPRECHTTKGQSEGNTIVTGTTLRQRGRHVAQVVMIREEGNTADGEFDLFQKVTVEDVQRVARTYFTPESRFLITINPGAARTPAQAAGGVR